MVYKALTFSPLFFGFIFNVTGTAKKIFFSTMSTSDYIILSILAILPVLGRGGGSGQGEVVEWEPGHLVEPGSELVGGCGPPPTGCPPAPWLRVGVHLPSLLPQKVQQLSPGSCQKDGSNTSEWMICYVSMIWQFQYLPFKFLWKTLKQTRKTEMETNNLTMNLEYSLRRRGI